MGMRVYGCACVWVILVVPTWAAAMDAGEGVYVYVWVCVRAWVYGRKVYNVWVCG